MSFPRYLWVDYGGVEAEQDEAEITLTGKDEDSYLKVFNHFGRLYKLYGFENGHWVDATTGEPPGPLDESLAGHVAPDGSAAS